MRKRLESNQVKEQLSRDAAAVVTSFDFIRCSGTPESLVGCHEWRMKPGSL